MSNKLSRPVRGSRSASPADLDRLLDEARTLQAQGRGNEAFSRYQAAYALAPEHAEVLHGLGTAYLGMGQPAVGIAFLRRAMAQAPQAMGPRINLALALAQQGQAAEAIALMEAACEMHAGEGEPRALLAQLLQQAGRVDEAERRYAQALACDDSRAEWHEALARLRHARWALPEAMQSAARACALSKRVAERLNIGYAEPSGAQAAPPRADRLVEPAPGFDAAGLQRACEERELLVFDDFMPEGLRYREEALRLCAEQAATLSQVNFPGVQTPPQPCAEIMQRIADALGRTIKWDSPDHGALRVSLANNEARADVHVDSPTIKNIFGGVLYLSLPEHCRGGTSFYRHRASGWDRRPDEATLRALGYDSFLAFQKRNLPINRRMPFAQWQAQRDAMWERLFEVPMRFNRLIVFRSDFFHAVTELFGDRPENGRLVQLFHFEAAESV